MEQKRFALSWGRKMFFGLTWPLICLFGLSYFQAKIFPQTFIEIVYLFLTYLGHYGLLTIILYYVFYVPVAWIFPTYYLTRFWSLFLTIFPCVLITVDSTLYGSYRIHIDKFIIQMVVDGASKEIFNLKYGILFVAVSIFLTLVFYFWFFGEKTWRHMQRRFNNENSNWYFGLILTCLFTGHFLHIYSDAYGNRKILRHDESFFLYFPATAKDLLAKADLLPKKIEVQPTKSSDFNYPMDILNCEKDSSKNIVFLVVKDWSDRQYPLAQMPYLSHLSTHGKVLPEHKSQNFDFESGVFSLLYGLPSTYSSFIKKDQRSPVFINELLKNNYKLGIFSELNLDTSYLKQTSFLGLEVKKLSSDFRKDFYDWMRDIDYEKSRNSFFMFSIFANAKELDLNIQTIVDYLSGLEVSKETIFIVTSANVSHQSDELSVPMVMLWPEVNSLQTNDLTTHIDLVPTFMKHLWKCSTPVASYSDGQAITDSVQREWLVAGEEKHFKIFDYLKKQIVTVSSLGGYSVKDFQNQNLPRHEMRYQLLFEILNRQSRFRK